MTAALNPGLELAHVDVVGGHVKLGKHAKRPDRRNLSFGRYLVTPSGAPGLPAIPPHRTWSAGAAAMLPNGWGMKANDRLGDCTCAGIAHAVQTWTALGRGTVTDPSDDAVVALYDATGTGDTGRFMLDVLNYVQKNGAFGQAIEAFAEIKRGSSFRKLTMAAIDLFGCAYVGVALPKSAQSQVVWKATRGPSAMPGSWGGHAIELVDYDVHGLTCVTWGKLLRMTWGFFERYCDEAYAIIAPSWFESGKAPSGFNAAALRADLQAIRR